jgi:serine/threonine protein phosphatase PrpC
LESNSNAHTKYDTFSFDVEQGDVLFLATDGVYNFIDLNHVNDFISNNHQNNFALISKSVVQKALENRSNDNLTSVIFECRPANGE